MRDRGERSSMLRRIKTGWAEDFRRQRDQRQLCVFEPFNMGGTFRKTVERAFDPCPRVSPQRFEFIGASPG